MYSAWDAQFYPAGIDPWMVKLDADTSHGGLSVDSRFYPHGPDFLGLRVHQTRLQGGDASGFVLLPQLTACAPRGPAEGRVVPTRLGGR
ncbi:selenium-binding family protein [Streptomyces sp. RLB3-17]|uniref:selenium-binding family protein n=1 Tax=Streptomyces sp. RLB3-17 TaxID=2594455 RepID=UPI0021F15303|nr:selenium-binding family protein [Streptomyces sp. RLB3-17]